MDLPIAIQATPPTICLTFIRFIINVIISIIIIIITSCSLSLSLLSVTEGTDLIIPSYHPF